MNVFKLADGKKLRMRDSYKRFVKTWIRFANPWVRTVLWPQILTPKRFDSYPTIRILRILDSYRIVDYESWLQKIGFESLVTNSVNFQRFACFYESNESLWILSTIAQNESLKIEIRESESLRILKFWIRESGFENPNLKDSYHGFDL
jgi:hypothetical protein